MIHSWKNFMRVCGKHTIHKAKYARKKCDTVKTSVGNKIEFVCVFVTTID